MWAYLLLLSAVGRSSGRRALTRLLLALLILLVPNASWAGGKIVAEGLKVLSRGGEGGRALMETSKTARVLSTTCETAPLAVSDQMMRGLQVDIGGALEAAATEAAVESMAKNTAATNRMMSQMGFTDVAEAQLVDHAMIDGWLSMTSPTGNLLFVEPTGRTWEELYEAAKANAVKPTTGESQGLIFYVNGIRTTPEEHAQTLRFLSDASQHDVVGVYNATRGAFWDVAQTGLDRFSNIGRGIAERWGLDSWINFRLAQNKAIDTISELTKVTSVNGVPLEVAAHSQGGAATSLALQRARFDLISDIGGDPLAHVSVTSLGSAARVWPYSIESRHLVHVYDATPRILGLGASEVAWGNDATLAGPMAQVVRFSGKGPLFTPDAARAFVTLPKVKLTKYHDVNTVYIQAWEQFLGTTVEPVETVQLAAATAQAKRSFSTTIRPEDVLTVRRSITGRHRIFLRDGRIIDAQRVQMGSGIE